MKRLEKKIVDFPSTTPHVIFHIHSADLLRHPLRGGGGPTACENAAHNLRAYLFYLQYLGKSSGGATLQQDHPYAWCRPKMAVFLRCRVRTAAEIYCLSQSESIVVS